MGFAGYFTSLFLFFHPKTVAVLICLAFTFLNYRGIRQSAGLNNLLVAAKLLILSFFIILEMDTWTLETAMRMPCLQRLEGCTLSTAHPISPSGYLVH